MGGGERGGVGGLTRLAMAVATTVVVSLMMPLCVHPRHAGHTHIRTTALGTRLQRLLGVIWAATAVTVIVALESRLPPRTTAALSTNEARNTAATTAALSTGDLPNEARNTAATTTAALSAGDLPNEARNTATAALSTADDERGLLVEGLGPPICHRDLAFLRSSGGSLATTDARWHVKPRHPLVRERRDLPAFAALDGQLSQPVAKDEGEEALTAVHVVAVKQAGVCVEVQAE